MAYRILRYIWRINRRTTVLMPSVHKNLSLISKSQWQLLDEVKFYSNTKLSINFASRLKLQNIEENFERLRSEQISTGSVNYDLLLRTAGALDQTLSAEQINFLIECCASNLPTQKPEQRMRIFNIIWKYLTDNNLQARCHYLSALNVFRVNNITLTNYQEFLDQYKINDDPEIYEALIWTLCEQGNVEKANDLLNKVRDKKLPLTENISNAFILGYSRSGDLKQCEGVLETMSAANITPSSETYAEYIKAYIENNNEEKAIALLTDYGNMINVIQIRKIVESAAKKGYQSIVDKTIKLLPTDLLHSKEIPMIFRNVCTEMIYSGSPDQAFLIANAFPKPDFSENQDIDTFGRNLINDLIRSDQPLSKTVEICKKLIESEKNARALHIACEIGLRKYTHSLEYLKALSEVDKLRPHYFWPILIQRFTISGEIGIIETLKTMSSLNVECDFETLAFYILPKLSLTLQDSKKAVQILESCGLKTSLILTPIVSHLILQQRTDDALSLVELYQSKLDTEQLVYPLSNLAVNVRATKRYHIFAKLVNALWMKGQDSNFDLAGMVLLDILANPKFKSDQQAIEKILLEFKKNGIKLSSVAADTVFAFLSSEGKESSLFSVKEIVDKNLKIPQSEYFGSFIIHPRDMSMDQLECHLIELESKGLNTRGVLRRLLQICVREGKLERSLEIKKKCEELKVQVSPGMMASILEMYIKLKRLNEAEEYLQNIKKTFPGFNIDEHKIIDLASLLVEKNRLDDAKKMLAERSATTKIIGGAYVHKNLWRLLTSTAMLSTKSPEYKNATKELFYYLQKLGYCGPHNTLLGPIIRAHLLIKEIKEAVNTYEHFVDKYKKTPLQFELMSTLVALSNGEMLEEFKINVQESKELLQKVIAKTAAVHGSANTNSCFVLAVAKSGTDGQLRKLLINPEIRLNPDALIKNCEHLSSSGRVDVLLKLAKACRGMGHAVKEQSLYDILLNSLIKENNCEAALELFQKLESDDEFKISQTFIKNLVDLFKMNNFEIPTNVAIRARNV